MVQLIQPHDTSSSRGSREDASASTPRRVLMLGAVLVCLMPPPGEAQIIWSGPITITSGGTYSGNWRSLDPNTPAVSIQTPSPVTIRDANISGKGTLIEDLIGGSHLTVLNVNAFGLNPEVAGKSVGRFIDAEAVGYLNVSQNYLENTAGIYVLQPIAGNTIYISRNSVKNINGRYSTGVGDGYKGSDGLTEAVNIVQFVQFDRVNSPGAKITFNQIINDPYISRSEDVINMYQSTGNASQPIIIHDNYIEGSYPGQPEGNTFSGGGIIVDQGSSYVNIYNNQVIETTNYGLGNASSGGHNNIYGNTVLGIGILPSGNRAAAQNVGIYDMGGGSGDTIHNNTIGWYNALGVRNDLYIPNCPPTTCAYNNKILPSPITKATEDAEWTKWQQKLERTHIQIGSQSHM